MALSDAVKSLVAAMDPDWQDATGQDYQNCIERRKTVAVTVFSTSGVDVAAHGSGLIWLPWITDQSITMCDIMDMVGEMTRNRAELARLLQEFRDDTRLAAFCDECKDQASAFDTSADICEVFWDLERNLA